MKRALIFSAFLALAVACEPAEQPTPTPIVPPSTPSTPTTPGTGTGTGTTNPPSQPTEPTTYSFSVSPQTLVFPSDGGSLALQLTTDANWEAATQDQWITISPAAGEGNATVTLTATANEDTQYERRATVYFFATGENVKGEFSFDVTQEKAEAPVQPSISVQVTTGAASSITSTSANITCNYSGAPSVGVYDRGVYYGTSSSVLDKEAGVNSSTSTSGYYTVKLSSLEPGTTYYYQAYVIAWDEATQKYLEFKGSVLSFKTESGGTTETGLQYLGGYEIPAVSLKNPEACSNYGKETYGNTYWYNYNTTNNDQMIITHTYAYGGKKYRNYTCLVDRTKKAPLWSAFVMHKDAYPDEGVGRSGSWKEDPGIPSSWQQCSSNSGFSRGHFVASNYRQATSDANKQTFYYTNQALQYQTSFNDGIWNSLEQAVKSNAPSGRDTLYVVVGVLYENSKTVGGVPCPSHFYKLLMKCSFNSSGTMTAAKGCAYLFTNESHSGENYSSGITTIDAVEQRSGWDFFANVPKNLQDTAEAQKSSVW